MDIFDFNIALFAAAFGFSTIASYFDLKTGEIPDKFTVGLVVVALAMRAVFSASLGDVNYLFDGAIVGGLFFLFGAFLFYTGGWGGGDAKLIAGIGAAIGGFYMPSVINSTISIFPDFFGFFVAMSIAAIPYSIGYAFIISLKHREVFSETRKALFAQWFVVVLLVVLSASVIIVLSPNSLVLSLMLMLPVVLFILMVFTRNVERIAMQKEVKLADLREGDMLAEDLFLGKKKVASKRDMDGISKEVLEKIRSSKQAPNTVRIKWGIRFAPAFPLALLVAPFWAQLIPALF